MTSFHDPERPRLGNGRPCWLGVQVALPSLHLTPGGTPAEQEIPSCWTVELVLVNHWVGYITTSSMELEELLADWRNDPEKALRNWFKAEPPREIPKARPVVQETVGTVTASAEDLGL